jgi:hypothetical protein
MTGLFFFSNLLICRHSVDINRLLKFTIRDKSRYLTKRRLKKIFEEFGTIEGIHVCFSKKEKNQRCICLQMLNLFFQERQDANTPLSSPSSNNKQECSHKACLASSSLNIA